MISSHIAKDPYTPTPNVYKICVWVAADPPPPPSAPASIGLRVPGKHAAGAHQVLASGGGQSNKIRLCITVHVVPAEGNLSLVRSTVPTLAKIAAKKLVALASGEKLRVERRARKLGWWKPQQHVPCEKDDE